MHRKQGIATQFIVIVIGLVMVLALSGFNLTGLISVEGIKEYTRPYTTFAKRTYNQHVKPTVNRYVAPTASYVWNVIIVDVTLDATMHNLRASLNGEPTDIEKLLEINTSEKPAAEPTTRQSPGTPADIFNVSSGLPNLKP